jgi:DNA-directed RNA polymerase subunit M/transcription elongation factor TFIIS
MARTLVWCVNCNTMTMHTHKHDTAHGIPETHMAGTERFECDTCGYSIHKNDPEARPLRFVLD